MLDFLFNEAKKNGASKEELDTIRGKNLEHQNKLNKNAGSTLYDHKTSKKRNGNTDNDASVTVNSYNQSDDNPKFHSKSYGKKPYN